MRIYAIVCYIVAALAEAGGLVLVVLAFRNNRAVLNRWRLANPDNNDGGSWGQIAMLNRFVTDLLEQPRWRQRLAVALILIGIVAGALGNLTGLPPR